MFVTFRIQRPEEVGTKGMSTIAAQKPKHQAARIHSRLSRRKTMRAPTKTARSTRRTQQEPRKNEQRADRVVDLLLDVLDPERTYLVLLRQVAPPEQEAEVDEGPAEH